jgi:hypothetical protein
MSRCPSAEHMKRKFVLFYEYNVMEQDQKPINPKCNIALSALCETDNFNLYFRIGRGFLSIMETVSRGRDEIKGTAE